MGQILFNLACTFAAQHEKSFVPAVLFKSLFINYLITLSLEKGSIVLKKSLEKVMNFRPKICTNSVQI